MCLTTLWVWTGRESDSELSLPLLRLLLSLDESESAVSSCCWSSSISGVETQLLKSEFSGGWSVRNFSSPTLSVCTVGSSIAADCSKQHPCLAAVTWSLTWVPTEGLGSSSLTLSVHVVSLEVVWVSGAFSDAPWLFEIPNGLADCLSSFSSAATRCAACSRATRSQPMEEIAIFTYRQ